MMTQNVRARRTKVVETTVDDIKSENITLRHKIAKFIVQLSVLGLISIIIFYSVRFIYIGLFGSKFETNKLHQHTTSGDMDEMGVYWNQPIISLDLIPNNIFTTSETNECENMNKEWNINKFTEQEAINIIKKELDLSDNLLSIVDDPMDLFKYVIMNKYGGFYIDKIAECKDNIDEWIQFYYPTKHIHYNNYILTYELLNEDQINKYLNLDMIIAFESSMPFVFSNWAFFTKPNNPIINFIIDSYLDYINKNNVNVKQKNDIYVGSHIFTEAIVGFIDAFTNDRDQALTFHKFEDGKGHLITLYIDEKNKNNNDLINILVVPLPDLWKIARRRRIKINRHINNVNNVT
eukprot:209939_1